MHRKFSKKAPDRITKKKGFRELLFWLEYKILVCELVAAKK